MRALFDDFVDDGTGFDRFFLNHEGRFDGLEDIVNVFFVGMHDGKGRSVNYVLPYFGL
jgi:hypothetical protein